MGAGDGWCDGHTRDGHTRDGHTRDGHTRDGCVRRGVTGGCGLAADVENLQKLLETTRAESLAKQQSASALRAERDTLSHELAGLKAEDDIETISRPP